MFVVSSISIVSQYNAIPLAFKPVWWLDGNDVTGTAVNPTTGTSLSTWVDKTGWKNNVTQSTAAFQPVFNTGVKNGLAAVNLSGVQGMVTANPPAGWTFGTSPRSIFYAFNMTNITGMNNILSNQGGGGNGDNFASGHLNVAGATIGIDSGGSGQYVRFSPTVLVAGTYYVCDYTSPSNLFTAATVNTNNVPQSVVSAGYTGGVLASSAVSISNPGGAGLFGNMLECIAYNYQLTPAQASVVRSYLQTKWAI